MDRREWEEVTGHSIDSSIECDLEWSLFQARRCMTAMKAEHDERVEDWEMKFPNGQTIITDGEPKDGGEV